MILGYAFNTSHESLQGINKFKNEFFGVGELDEESNYTSILLYILLKLRQNLKRK